MNIDPILLILIVVFLCAIVVKLFILPTKKKTDYEKGLHFANKLDDAYGRAIGKDVAQSVRKTTSDEFNRGVDDYYE